ncbi:MAG: NERD domain-containing protein [Anaerolineales bacterium]|nr:NERD domain-containing protein [Anaerolineales bacterium]MCX7756054.1 NERD domain-containing protein [Anaerolineales bacterium]MDW8278557.1 nuclease-related domain-containing protein [Anaerolineales bacterium]
MRILDPQWTHLSKGYQAVRDLERQARQNWERAWGKSVAFAREQGLKRAAATIQAQIRAEKRTLRLVLVLLAGVLLFMAILVALADSYPFLRPFLLPVGVINLLQALILFLPIAEKVLAIVALSKIQPPAEEPQTSLELTEQWWQAVSSREPLETGDAAETGQVAFLKFLAEHLPDDYFAVRSPFLQSSLNIDVLVIGPTGLWLFETRHWRGRVICRAGVWQREPSPDAPLESLTTPLDRSWLVGRKIIETTLSAQFARQTNFGALIRGGLVFTHPEVQLELDSSSKVEAGTPPQWLQRIRNAARLAHFSTEVQLFMLDALLDYALALYVTRPIVQSAVELAKTLYGDLLEDLRQYILRQVRSRLAAP